MTEKLQREAKKNVQYYLVLGRIIVILDLVQLYFPGGMEKNILGIQEV